MKRWIKKRHRMHVYISPQSKIILLLVGSLYFGIVAGSMVIRFSDNVKNILIGYAQSITSSAPPVNILLNDFIISFIFFCALFLLGMSVYGYVFIPVFPFIKGFSYGFSAAFFYAVFGARAILICALAILPQALLFSVFLLTGCYLAFVKSRSFRTREASRYFEGNTTKRYCLIFLSLFAASFLLVIFDIFCTGNVIQFFC